MREFITSRCRSVVRLVISMEIVVRAENIVGLDAKNPHIRNTRHGTVSKLDVNNRVLRSAHVDLSRSNRSSFAARVDGELPNLFRQPCKTGGSVQR